MPIDKKIVPLPSQIMTQKDTFRTIISPISEVIFKDKSSKFLGYALPVTSQEQIKEHLEIIKKEHFSARHWCYAWQLGKRGEHHRANDDGEPSGTAGLPIYGQIQSLELTNILVVVVRYFGGIKLGVGGLINAYKTTAQLTLQEAEIQEFTINTIFEIQFDYKHMNKVMRVIKERNLSVIDQKLTTDCRIYVEVRQSEVPRFEAILSQLYEISFKIVDDF